MKNHPQPCHWEAHAFILALTQVSACMGHFMALCLMKRLQLAGNKPIVRWWHGMIGDPSGRTDIRTMMTKKKLATTFCFIKQMERFIDFGDDKAIAVNNGDWLLISTIYSCFGGGSAAVNTMLRATCYKQRLDRAFFPRI